MESKATYGARPANQKRRPQLLLEWTAALPFSGVGCWTLNPQLSTLSSPEPLALAAICSQHAGVNKTIHSQQSERVREALVKLRQNARLTQRQLAKKLRREHSLISRLELGERRVDVVEFFWICQACGADPARATSTLMRQFAKIQSDSPGSL